MDTNEETRRFDLLNAVVPNWAGLSDWQLIKALLDWIEKEREQSK